MNKISSFADAGSFLEHAQAALEADEATNSLILGVCLRLKNRPAAPASPVCLKTIEDEHGLALTAMMTPPHNLSITGQVANLDCTLGLLVSEMAGEGWKVPGVLAPTQIARLFAEMWADKTQAGSQFFEELHLFELRQAPSPAPAGLGRLRLANEQDGTLVGRWWYSFNLEIFNKGDEAELLQEAQQRIQAGDVFVWENGGQVVCMAMKNRPTRRSICVSQVYTPPEQRGKGYATACVGDLSRQLLQSGWEFCTLFVNAANLPAYKAYQKIGYRLVREFEEYRFQPG
jgi:uncharacterized protein